MNKNAEATPGRRAIGWIEIFAMDLRYAARSLRQRPTFAIVVSLLLSIGIGANSAVLSIMDAAYLRKVPAVPDPDRLIGIHSGTRSPGARRAFVGRASFPEYEDLRRSVAGVTGIAAFDMITLIAGDSATVQPTWTALVSGTYFSVLGAHPALGRFIDIGDEQPRGVHHVAVIGDLLWRTRFAADPRVLGRSLRIHRTMFTIIGVAPSGFVGMHPEGRTDLWIPYTTQAEAIGSEYTYDDRGNRPAVIIGRLAAGASVAEAQASLDRAAENLLARYPTTNTGINFDVRLQPRLVDREVSRGTLPTMLFIWAIIALVHLVACGNVASLILARAMARRRELGIRLCLGASRARVVSQSLTESALLAALGAAGGVLVGRVLVTLITSMQFMSALDPGLNGRVVAIVALIAGATALQFGILPALDASRRDPLATLRGATAGLGIAGRQDRGPAVLVLGQVAFSLILLAEAAVLVQALAQLSTGRLGYDADHLVVATVPVPRQSTKGDWVNAYENTLMRASALPGVSRVAAADAAPLLGRGRSEELSVPGVSANNVKTSVQLVGPGYFATIGASLARGREFDAHDRLAPDAKVGTFDVVVVNEMLARQLWPAGDAIGKQLERRGASSATVVGVVRDMRDGTLRGPQSRAYFPLLEAPYGGFSLLVRTPGDPALLTAPIRSIVASSAQNGRSGFVTTLSEQKKGQLELSRVGSMAFGTCAAAALLLTAIGLYGLVATWSAERRAEIGIRIALGAPRVHVHQLLLAKIARLVGVGAFAGLAVAVALVRLERTWWGPQFQLGITATAGTLLIFALIAAVAVFIPARRAANVDPLEALRSV